MIFINDRVKAFTCGERLNAATAVIYLEKADPELRGLRTAKISYYGLK